jgi:hypothetical protein
MIYTAAVVPMTDFLTGVLSALGIYGGAFLVTTQVPLIKARKNT